MRAEEYAFSNNTLGTARCVLDKNTGCWLWQGFKNPEGYGKLKYNQKMYYAHRFIYQLDNENIPEGLFLCHKCDTPSCCNPVHMFLGTHQDNMDDMNNKGRRVSSLARQDGGFNGNSKLTVEEVLAIRRLYSTGNHTQKQLGEIFGVTHSSISLIVLEKKWA